MKNKSVLITRLLLGALLLAFGLNGFFHFMPNPPSTEEAGALLGALGATGYFFPFVKSIEILTGLLLLSNKFTALALAIFTPVLVGIAQINFILNPAGIPVTLVLLALHLYLAYQHRAHYKPLFKQAA
ncbi:MAG: DoxX family protein [Bdellovibrionales bacterium]